MQLRLFHDGDELPNFSDERFLAAVCEQFAEISTAQTNTGNADFYVFRNVLQAHSARNHETNFRKRPLHLTNKVRAAGEVGRENFYQIGMSAMRRDDFRRSRRPRKTSNIRGMTNCDQVYFQRWCYHKLCASGDRSLGLLRR